MKNNIVSGFALIATLALFATTTATASPARLSGMGMEFDTIGTYWMVSGDDTIIMLNPAELSMIRPEIWLGLKPALPAGYYGCGVILGIMPGVNVSVTTGLPLSIAEFKAEYPAAPLPTVTQEQVNLAIAFPIGSLKLGFSGMVTDIYSVDTTPGTETSDTALIFGAAGGFFLDLGKDISVEASLKSVIHLLDCDALGANVYESHTADFGVFSRFNWGFTEKNTLHVAGQYWLNNRAYTPGALEPVSNMTNQISLGVSDEYQITKKTLLYFGAQGAFSLNTVIAGDSRNIQVKVAGGMESAFTDFLVFRLGANRVFFDQVEVANDDTRDNLEKQTSVHVGVGITLAELVVDMELNKSLLTDGPNFISGVNNAPGPWSAVFSVTYSLDGKK